MKINLIIIHRYATNTKSIQNLFLFSFCMYDKVSVFKKSIFPFFLILNCYFLICSNSFLHFLSLHYTGLVLQYIVFYISFSFIF